LLTTTEKGLTTAEAITLANRLVNRKVTASQLIDEGFNRDSTYHKDGLPSWFLDEEAQHYRPNVPITKEAIKALRDRQRALDARPIKKIAEAKWRKKLKAHQRIEKAKRKADGVMETEDLNDGEKARQVSKLLRRAAAGAKRPEKKVVVAKGSNRGIKGRPKGVRGKYKIVDARMRKEVSNGVENYQIMDIPADSFPRLAPSSVSQSRKRSAAIKLLTTTAAFIAQWQVGDCARDIRHCILSMFVLPCMAL
jgi:AdoMet-dependent rRNA methyltransferase SPB1